MNAFGATPERPHVGGWSLPAGAQVFASPAAIPATCVPWNEALRSSGSFPAAPDPGPGKARATMIFPFVNCVSPSGKPAGGVKPAPLRNGFVLSTPSSTTPIFTPSPLAPVVWWGTSAPMTGGARFRARGEALARQLRQRGRRDRDGEAVEHDLVAPGHPRGRHRTPQLRDRLRLL